MISHDLRKRIIEAHERGEGSSRELARRFSVGHATVERLLRRYRLTGSYEALPHGGGHKSIVRQENYPMIARWVEERSDLTQQEIADRFTAETGRIVSRRTISRVLRRMHQSRKKSL